MKIIPVVGTINALSVDTVSHSDTSHSCMNLITVHTTEKK